MLPTQLPDKICSRTKSGRFHFGELDVPKTGVRCYQQ
jgi:hypothetical protein